MLGPDLANRLQPAADLALRPALPAPEITDKLVGLVAGQRLLAEIQSLMPNGSYRALINQRSVTLALPFAAKSGDAIELEVAQSDGKLTLAVVARAASETGRAGGESAATSLSRTGQLISNLLGGVRDGKAGQTALPLNGNHPLASSPPRSGNDLLPLLRQAIVQSGMFYEAHQAEWVEGRYSKAQLLQEPQGKLASATPAQPGSSGNGATGKVASVAADGAEPASGLASKAAAATPSPHTAPAVPGAGAPALQPVAPQAQAIVQQQLEAFATQTFSWQGQVWPGQQIHWQIDSETADQQGGGGDSGERWQTRLRLTLPRLGEVDARLHIQGEQLMLTLIAGDAKTRALLRDEAATLRSQFTTAGLDLAALGIAAPPENEVHVPAGE
ncbi:MAG: flagellar hook-length control protein FliK [Rhodobacteraceae bacterium]|nr:flagellar hook-length control protein FliK [Paracoccaceae bacterium]